MPKGQTRALIAEVLHTLLSHAHGRTLSALAIGFVVWLSMDSFAHAFAAFLEYAIEPLAGKGSANFVKAALHLTIPAALLLAVVTWLWWWLSRAPAPPPAATMPREVHPTRGLIVNLSKFRGEAPLDSVKAVAARLDSMPAVGASEAVREQFIAELFKTNWGPVAAAVIVHDRSPDGASPPVLEACWVVCSQPSREAREDDTALQLIRWLTSQRVHAESVVLADQNSVEEMLRLIESIYTSKAGARNMRPEDVTADMTGGTAAMTAGMVLATLDDSRPLEYLSQPFSLLDAAGRPKYGEALRKILRPVPTSPRMVAQAFGRFLADSASGGTHA